MVNDDSAQKNAQFGASDWTRLASQALDMWQAHLTNLANDPKAKEEMARLIAPMSQMYVEWANMMQNFAETPASATTTTSPEPESTQTSSSQEETSSPKDEAPKEAEVEQEASSSQEETASFVSEDENHAPEALPQELPASPVSAEEENHDESDIERVSDPLATNDAHDDEPVGEGFVGSASEPAPEVTAETTAEITEEPEPLTDPTKSLAELSSIARSFGSASESDAGESEPSVTQSHAKPVPEPASEPVAVADYDAANTFLPPESGSPASTDRSRGLAELAERLAKLEQELDHIRGSRKDRLGNVSGNDGNSDVDFRELAGAAETKAS